MAKSLKTPDQIR